MSYMTYIDLHYIDLHELLAIAPPRIFFFYVTAGLLLLITHATRTKPLCTLSGLFPLTCSLLHVTWRKNGREHWASYRQPWQVNSLGSHPLRFFFSSKSQPYMWPCTSVLCPVRLVTWFSVMATSTNCTGAPWHAVSSNHCSTWVPWYDLSKML